MKKIVLGLVIFTSFISANAQSYLGYFHDNYAGVQGVLYNPSSIVDSRFKADINLFSMSTAVGNDMYGVKIADVFKDGYDFDLQAKKNFTIANNAYANLDLMGPSFMFNIAPKHSLAFYTRARAFVNVVDVNGKVINDIAKDNSTSFPSASIGNPNAVGNSWGEFGISYAAVMLQNGQHFLKGGITAKYLQGVANYHFQGTGVNLQYNENILLPQNSTYVTTGTAVYGSSQDFANDSKVSVNSKSRGLGLDLGFTYEWRPEYDASRADLQDFKHVNKYKLRLGVSVTDLGSMKYDKGIRNGYNLNKTVTQADFDNADSFDQFMENNYAKTVINGSVTSYLPTALHTDVDWNIHGKFYLNANGDFGLVSNTKLNQNSIANRVSLTPRFESKNFSFYVPISYMDYSKQTLVGVGLRTGVFFIGSGSALSNLISSDSRAMDVYLGTKIPIYQHEKNISDKDSDGVIDKLDACPTIAGPIENRGCPWEDKDGDSVLDNVDKCPDVAGPVENNGCPWSDKDNDGVYDKDDKCPDLAGPVENNGCPWSDKDNDGVFDKDDKCPTVKGTIANNGCPEVSAEVIKKLNAFSKAIMFNSGKSTIRPESNVKLEEIVKVMNEYNVSTFQLNGYTDNTGIAAKNLQLSKDRAAAVKNYLVSKGISADRLSSEGFGIETPIDTNKTPAGRAQNRRVEIILVK